MMFEDKVSVIIPVYNTKKYLKRSVSSVLEQTYMNLQIILVDDGSTDGSSELCDAFKMQDNRIEVIHKENEGLGLTRNAGLDIADGKYVTFLDSDDWFSETHIEKLMEAVSDKRTELVIGSHTKCRHDESVIEQFELPEYGSFNEKEIKNNIMLSVIAAHDHSSRDLGLPMSVCFSLYQTEIINKNHIRFKSERITACEDVFFNLQYMDKIQCARLVKEYGYFYRFNPVSITKGFDKRQTERMIRLYHELINHAEELKMPVSAQQRIDRCMLAKLRTLLFMILRSDLKYREKQSEIRSLLKMKPFEDILKRYPAKNYRLSLRVTTCLMKYRMTRLLFLVLSIKERSVNK